MKFKSLMLATVLLQGAFNLPFCASADELRTVTNGSDVNEKGWVLTYGEIPTIDIPGEEPVMLSTLKRLPVAQMNNEGDVITVPRNQDTSCVVYRYTFSSKLTEKFVVATNLSSYTCESTAVALAPNSGLFGALRSPSSDDSDSSAFKGAIVSAAGVTKPLDIAVEGLAKDDYVSLYTMYVASDERIVVKIGGSKNLVKIVNSSGAVERSATNDFSTVFANGSASDTLIGSDGYTFVVQDSASGSSRRYKLRGPNGPQYSTPYAYSIRQDGVSVGYVNVSSATFSEPSHAYLTRARRPSIDINCLFPNSVGNFASASDLTESGYFLASLTLKDGSITSAVIPEQSLLHRSNYCTVLKAKMVGECDKYFQNDKSGSSIKQVKTYPLDKKPNCSMQVSLSDSRGNPLKGRTIVLLGGSDSPEARASAVTNSAGTATLKYPINALETRNWGIQFWNDRIYRPSAVPVTVKTLDY